jgi:hypothetical protein
MSRREPRRASGTSPEDGQPLVRLVRSRAEREGVYRLRYDVYTRELAKGFLGTVDHDRGWIKDPEDEAEGVALFYSGPPHAMTGTLRVQVWAPGSVSKEVAERFSLHLFPGIEHYRVSEAARLVVVPEMRGGATAAALACAAFDHLAARHDVFVCFLYCAPGLVHRYLRLGFRPYPGFVIPNEDGIRLPMFLLASDVAHLRAVGSPLAPLMARHFLDGRALPDMTPFDEALRGLEAHFEVDPARVWSEVCDRLAPGPQTCSPLLEGLAVGDAEALCRTGFVMEIPAGKVVLREGLVERELYLALTGRYAIRMGGVCLAELGAGDVLGEVSFFQDPGRRVATVHSLTAGRVLVLERHFLERLVPAHPDVACRLLFNLGRILSRHLAMALEAHVHVR